MDTYCTQIKKTYLFLCQHEICPFTLGVFATKRSLQQQQHKRAYLSLIHPSSAPKSKFGGPFYPI